MQAKSCLILKNYIVKNINFSINENFQFNQNVTIKINPEFRREIKKIDNNNAAVNLFFCIKNEKDDLPFSMEVNIEGQFHLENWEQPDLISLIVSNSIAILFPYLRSIISMITANANISPYMLPVMNIAALFEQDENDDLDKKNIND